MNPIINPWWIYLAEKSETLGTAFCLTGVLIIVACGLVNLFNFIDEGEALVRKGAFIVSAVMIFIGVLLPNQKTVLTMMTVQQLTPNNIEIAGNTIETTIDYIVDKVEEILEEDD